VYTKGVHNVVFVIWYRTGWRSVRAETRMLLTVCYQIYNGVTVTH